MSDICAPPESVARLDVHLRSQAGRAAFDMFDADELPVLEPFPRLHNAVAWLGQQLTPQWRTADGEAMRHQSRHQRLARIAIATGAGAIILAVVQLALRQSWPRMLATAGGLEIVIVLAAVASVFVGHWARSDRHWLGFRHRAEQLRMLKFRALARPELWAGHEAEWKGWLAAEIAALPAPDDLQTIERWSRQDTLEFPFADLQGVAASPEVRQALSTYYRHKRLLNQRDYFARKSREAEGNWTARLRHQRVRLFAVTIGFVLVHFAADVLAAHAERGNLTTAAHAWELVSLWSVVLAATLPVAGIGVRAWSAAFEFSRKARSFAAKHEAMDKAAARLENESSALPVVLGHLAHDELFLEQEHREWLRLLLDAEWFL